MASGFTTSGLQTQRAVRSDVSVWNFQYRDSKDLLRASGRCLNEPLCYIDGPSCTRASNKSAP